MQYMTAYLCLFTCASTTLATTAQTESEITPNRRSLDPSQIITCGVCDGTSPHLGRFGSQPNALTTNDCWDCGDDGSTVDVLFVYTEEARDDVGSKDAVAAKAAEAIEYTNLTLSNSGIDLVLSQVGLKFIDYTADADVADTCLHLHRLADPVDMYMDAVHAMRDEHRADLVCLFIGGPSVGGCALGNPPNPGNGFSVLAILNTVTGPTAAHEFGHNFGCSHGRIQEGIDDPYRFNFAYAFELPDGSPARTAVWSGPDFVPVYSSPDVLWEGVPTGGALETQDAASNALTIELNRRAIANYRVSGADFDCNQNGIADHLEIQADPDRDANANGLLDECEARLYVDQDVDQAGDGYSWAGARSDLRSTLADASMPCSNVTEIWVAEGVYRPDQQTDDPTRSHTIANRCRLSVFGGFDGTERSLDERQLGAHPSVLSGDLGQGVNAYHVLDVYSSNQLTIDGFEIVDGYANGNADDGDTDGGGLRIRDSQVTLRHLDVHDNRALRFGGGAVFFDSGRIECDMCEFRDNTAAGAPESFGGAIDNRNAELVLKATVIQNNTADVGAGVTIRGTSAPIVIEQSLIAGNASSGPGGGVWMDASSSLQIVDSELSANTADAGGGVTVWNGGHLSIQGSRLDDNSVASWGGAIDIWNAVDLSIGTSTISGNVAGPMSGAVQVSDGSTATISTTQFSENCPTDIVGEWNDAGGNEFIKACDCAADVNGDGNLDVLDFVFFQLAFVANDPVADCNGDGEFSVIDFVCFQLLFVAGC